MKLKNNSVPFFKQILNSLGKTVKKWLVTGLIILFFVGVFWQLFSLAKNGIIAVGNAIFGLIGIEQYTNTLPLLSALFIFIALCVIIGILLDWKPTRRTLFSIPLLGSGLALTNSIFQSVQKLHGLPAVLIESYDGIYTLAFVSGYEHIRAWRLLSEGEKTSTKRRWKLFGVPLVLTNEKTHTGLRFRLYYPDFPFIVNGRMGWAKPSRIEWILNPMDQIFARLASAGFATRLKYGKPLSLAKQEWDSLGLEIVALNEQELQCIVQILQKNNECPKPSA